MANDNWQRTKEIFANAIKVAPEKLASFLDEVCSNDAEMRHEIESLLSLHEDARSFLESPAVGEVAEVIRQAQNIERGRCFGHYEIIEPIGAGGMGEVYLALDKKLDRKVAVKILNEKFAEDESNLRRFIREAKAASALNHPNILVIHEIGESGGTHYIVSEFVEGETLREVFKSRTLKTAEILDISIQITSALCAAHASDIVHRDIKPENIMIRPDGYMKILDFGLAKLVERKSNGFEEEAAFKQNNTAKGLIMGTVNYMSPEQAKGESIDKRTDVFSLGVVIYETIAGVTPFAGDSIPETFANLINFQPPPIARFAAGVPSELERIISSMLRKNKDERYQTMHDVLNDLKSLRENLTSEERLEKSLLLNNEKAIEILQTATGDANRRTAETNDGFTRRIKRRKLLAAYALIVLIATIGFGFWQFGIFSTNPAQIESVAVLPFENQNPDTEYLSDGLTESIINNLSGLANLRIISRNSVFQYKGKNPDSMTVGRELNVRAILTGRFVQRGEDLIISAELTDLRDNKQIWGRQYTRKINDAFILQQDISQDISETLRKQMPGAERQQIAKRETDSPEAFQHYLKGRYQWNKRSSDGFIKAVEFYNQAIEKDPTYALAYVGLANCYLSVNFKSPITREERVGMVKAAASKALEIDPNLGGEVHAVLAINSHFNEWNWTTADREYKRAIELNPNYATAHHWYAEFLSTEGRFDESFAEYRRALELDPLSLAVKTDLGFNYYYSRQFDRAVEYLEKLKELNPNYSRIYYFLADVYEKKEMYAEAIAEDYQGSMLDGANSLMMSERNTALENAVKTSGAKGYYEKMAEMESFVEGVNSPTVTLAMYHARLGERNKAFELLEKGYNEHSQLLVWLKVSPKFDDLRSDPRYADLMRRVGLPQ